MGGPGGVCTGLFDGVGWLLLVPGPAQAESTSSNRSAHEAQAASTPPRLRAGVLNRSLAVLICISNPFSPEHGSALSRLTGRGGGIPVAITPLLDQFVDHVTAGSLGQWLNL